MLGNRNSVSLGRLFDLLALDVISVLVLSWLIIDNPRRWPILLVLVPVLLLINYLLGRRAFDVKKTSSYALPAIYFCGLVLSVSQVIEEFTWLRLGLVLLPLTLLVVSIKSVKRAGGPVTNRK